MEKRIVIHLLIVCVSILFVVGLWNIDLASTFGNLDDVFAESLLMTKVPPKTIYHLGMIISLASYLIVVALATYLLEVSDI